MILILCFLTPTLFASSNQSSGSVDLLRAGNSASPYGVIPPSQCNNHSPIVQSLKNTGPLHYASTNSDTITVTSALLNGTLINGIYYDLRLNNTVVSCGYTPLTFTNLSPGQTYELVAYWATDYYYRHFSNGNLNRYQLFSMNVSSSYNITGIYEYIPLKKLATLNIVAEFPNGTLIGQSYQQGKNFFHTPGMWIAITPPGSSTPYTGGYTGGSILPFDLVNHSSYTIKMAQGYQNINFSHWDDTGSNNTSRVLKIQGDTNLTAIYVQTDDNSTSTNTTTSTSNSNSKSSSSSSISSIISASSSTVSSSRSGRTSAANYSTTHPTTSSPTTSNAVYVTMSTSSVGVPMMYNSTTNYHSTMTNNSSGKAASLNPLDHPYLSLAAIVTIIIIVASALVFKRSRHV